ncbi:MAG: hypothetical protein ACYCX4_05985 [Bacillota bacterium]
MMMDFRCTCHKIVCQIEGDSIIIMCRHCKRYIHIHTKGILDIEYKLQDHVTCLNIG